MDLNLMSGRGSSGHRKHKFRFLPLAKERELSLSCHLCLLPVFRPRNGTPTPRMAGLGKPGQAWSSMQKRGFCRISLERNRRCFSSSGIRRDVGDGCLASIYSGRRTTGSRASCWATFLHPTYFWLHRY
ncbi:hypothetical protein I7I50_11108 [Histoplasma capsulatum G186AR]|uniref:Uncharacterized protein n=1 Tax=Ajellomyces capsulatus TaxID=5037 RepID=A0A8H7Z8H0_AJECA|nr:hypothetical protein I7I52_02347 [Histoplasma capsulatum]QSS69716.1 hypothetical protein I7I50_11108 [Histoplasma capsulatum G186AR]